MKLTIIGGGGVRTPRLIPTLVRRAPALDLQEVWLMDIDPDRLRLIGALCRFLAKELSAPFRLYLTTDSRAALAGAAHVITTIRPGFEAGRVADERIAFRHGVLGQETTGAGGFAMAMRSLPAILDYCRLAAEVAPGAWVYNFTNPAGLVAQGLVDAGVERVVGICDSANGAQHAVAAFLGLPLAEVRHEVFGLNHLSWTRSVKLQQDDSEREVLPDLLRDPAFIRATHLSLFDRDLIDRIGMFLNEYLHYFYYRDQALAALLAQTETRGEEIVHLNRRLLEQLTQTDPERHPTQAYELYRDVMDARSATYMAHARRDDQPLAHAGDDEEGYAGVALGVVEAIATNQPHFTGLNVPNNGAIEGMQRDDVVEVTCAVDGRGVAPIVIGAVPEMQYLLMRDVKRYERLAAEAILTRSRMRAAEALLAHPLIGSWPLAKALVGDFIEAHRDTVGDWR